MYMYSAAFYRPEPELQQYHNAIYLHARRTRPTILPRLRSSVFTKTERNSKTCKPNRLIQIRLFFVHSLKIDSAQFLYRLGTVRKGIVFTS